MKKIIAITVSLFNEVIKFGKASRQYFYGSSVNEIRIKIFKLETGHYYDSLIMREDLEKEIKILIEENDFEVFSHQLVVIDKTYLTIQVYAFLITIRILKDNLVKIGTLNLKIGSFDEITSYADLYLPENNSTSGSESSTYSSDVY